MVRRTHRNITWDQLVAALGNNGYEQISQKLFGTKNGHTVACAIGQTALNLGVDENDLQRALGGIKIVYNGASTPVSNVIINQNDAVKRTCAQIATFLSGKATPAARQAIFRVQRKDWSQLAPGYRGVTVPLGAVAARS